MKTSHAHRLTALRKFRQIEERTDSELERVWRNAMPDSPVQFQSPAQSAPALRAPQAWRTAQVERLLQTFPGKGSGDQIPINTEILSQSHVSSFERTQNWTEESFAQRNKVKQHLEEKMVKSTARVAQQSQLRRQESSHRVRELEKRGVEARERKLEQAESTEKNLIADTHKKTVESKARLKEIERHRKLRVRHLRAKGEKRREHQLGVLEGVKTLKEFLEDTLTRWRQFEGEARQKRDQEAQEARAALQEERREKREQFLDQRNKVASDQARRASSTRLEAAAIRRTQLQKPWVERIMSKTAACGLRRNERYTEISPHKTYSHQLNAQERQDFNKFYVALTAKSGYQQIVDEWMAESGVPDRRSSTSTLDLSEIPRRSLSGRGLRTHVSFTDEVDDRPLVSYDDEGEATTRSRRMSQVDAMNIADAKVRFERGCRRADRKAKFVRNQSTSADLNPDSSPPSPPSPPDDVGELDDQGSVQDPEEEFSDEDLYGQIERYLTDDRLRSEDSAMIPRGI